MRSVSSVLIAGAAGLCFCAGGARAASQLQFDVNSFTASLAPGATGFLPTPLAPIANVNNVNGTIQFSRDVNTTLGLLRDTAPTPLAAGFAFSDFFGSVTLANGSVTGGSFTIRVSDGVTTDQFSANLLSGTTSFIPFQGYAVLGVFFEGFFSGSTFGGVSVAEFVNAGTPNGLAGTFLNFAFLPNASGVDNDADMDVAIIIPLPGAAGLGLAGIGAVGGFGLLRRRR